MRSVNKVASRKRKKRILKLAKGNWGSRGRLFSIAKNTVEKGLSYAYRDRKVKKRTLRGLWIQRINAGVREEGLTYSQFAHLLKKKEINLNRKILADLAMNHEQLFKKIIHSVN